MENKGRGRGGVPLLPEGMWDALNRGERKDVDFEEGLNSLAAETTENELSMEMPTSFGGKSQSSGGWGAGRGAGRGRGRGLQRGSDLDISILSLSSFDDDAAL